MSGRCGFNLDQVRIRFWRASSRALALAFLVLFCSSARAADSCDPVLARVVSVKGVVQLRRADGDWVTAGLDATLCAADTVWVHPRSQAGLLLSNETTLRLDQGTILTLVEPGDKNATLLNQVGGAVHVITRTPRPFRVRTPFVNANVEGTEFVIRIDPDEATVVVFEGVVVASNGIGSVTVASGEQAIATRNSAPTKELSIRPRDAVVWTLYVPSVFDGRLLATDDPSPAGKVRQRSVALYQGGKIAEALAALDSLPEAEMPSSALAFRAGLLLLVGRIDEARPAIRRALLLDDKNADAYSLLAVVAVAENDRDLALEMARKAVGVDAASASAQVGLSYAWQANFRLVEALAAATRATELAPRNALAWARVAELRMSSGDLERALTAAREAVALDPKLAKTQTVFGFASLARIDTRGARASFEQAIALDPGDPLPRFGLGLAKIREGGLEEGRTEIEVSMSLDPGSSLIRSYLGKAYYEEKRSKLAASQFALAEQIDPRDPTPWFYDAIRKQSENRPVDALLDLEQSIRLNENRSVYRSHSLIEDDNASRFATAAAIFRELGFEKWAIAEGSKALAESPGNDSIHQELAVAYSTLPKHDIARVSEALQADLRAPISTSPLPLLLSTDNLVILRESGPNRLGQNEFNQLFARDRVSALLEVVGGNLGTSGDQLIVNGLWDKTALSLGQLHYETNGFDSNNQAEKNIYSLKAKQQISFGDTVEFEARRSEFKTGETLFAFSPADAFPLQVREVTDSLRLGGHLMFGDGHDVVWTLASESRERTIGGADFVLNKDTARTRVVELQHLKMLSNGYLLLGAGNTVSRDAFFDDTSITTRDSIAYAYANLIPMRSLSVQLGATLESFNQRLSAFPQQVTRRRINPKLGITWTPHERTTLRAAVFESVKRPLVGSQTLEQTQVSGFNQFFTGFDNFYGEPDGTVSRREVVAVDHKLSALTYVGAEVSKRRLKVPSIILESDVTWHEDTARFYLYRAITNERRLSATPLEWQFALSAEYENEHIRRPQVLTGVEGIMDLRTDRVPFAVKAFNGSGVSASVKTTYVRQRGDFSIDVGFPTFAKRDGAWLTDIALEYKLPRRQGVLSVGVQNLFDRPIDVIETDPVNPRVAKRRFMTAKARIVF